MTNYTKHSRFLFIVSFFIGYVAPTSVAADSQTPVPIPLRFAHLNSIVMIADDSDRDAMTSFALRRNGAYAIKQYDRILFGASQEYHSAELQWNDAPVHFVYFNGQRTISSAYSPMPLSMYEQVESDRDIQPGDSIHSRACVWPLLDELIPQGTWGSGSEDLRTLTLEHLNLQIRFDRFGRVLAVEYTTKTTDQIWSYHGYDPQGEHLYPSRMQRRLRVSTRSGESMLDEIEEYDLRFEENPEDINDLVSFEEIALRMNRIDLGTKDVLSPEGKVLYNQNDIENEYLRAVGIRDPIRTRNTLFVIIGVLATGSIVVWKRRTR